MTWYTDIDKTTLDYSKPIIAKSRKTDDKFLLLPTCKDGSYQFRGYDWFNIETGKWNSCVNFQTSEEAIKCYEKTYTISNYEFEV